jgi:hypothetical protein
MMEGDESIQQSVKMLEFVGSGECRVAFRIVLYWKMFCDVGRSVEWKGFVERMS